MPIIEYLISVTFMKCMIKKYLSIMIWEIYMQKHHDIRQTTFRLVVGGAAVVVDSIVLAVFCPPPAILSGAANSAVLEEVVGMVKNLQ